MVFKMDIIEFIVVVILLMILIALEVGLIWVICWCFGIVFTWKIMLGAWIVSMMLAGMCSK